MNSVGPNGISIVDIIAIIVMLAAVTILAHKLSSNGSSDKRSFFTANGSMPWWAVSSSLYVTVISSATFIALPASVFKAGGNLTYMQFILAVALGKILIAKFFVKPFFEAEGIDSLYDYYTERLDSIVSLTSMTLSIVFSFLAASIALLATSLTLSTIMNWPIENGIITIVIISVVWSAMGGLKTVIWTDFFLFLIFLAGTLFSIVWILVPLDQSLNSAFEVLDQNAKMVMVDLSIDPSKRYTVWATLFGATFFGMMAGAQQIGFQRIKACRTVRDARLAFNAAAILYIIQALLLGVGLALTLFYANNPLPEEAAITLAERPDGIFPYFIATEIPTGLAGIFIGAIFAAGISTVDSRLTELSDISVTNIYQKFIRKSARDKHYVFAARVALCCWGVIFGVVALSLSKISGEGLLDLGFRFQNYIVGVILATAILAILKVGRARTYIPGVVLAILATVILDAFGVSFFWWLPFSIATLVGFVLLAEKCIEVRARKLSSD